MSSLFFDQSVTFASLPLDRRLFKALARQQFIYPSLVQSKVIQEAIKGDDLLVQSGTGSGKTLAFAIPVLQNILSHQEAQQQQSADATSNKDAAAATNSIQALILLPTRELCHQVTSVFIPLLHFAQQQITLYHAQSDMPLRQHVQQLKSHAAQSVAQQNTHRIGVSQQQIPTAPHIVISTPAKALELLKAKAFTLSALRMYVIDECDLILQYGYDEEIQALNSMLPRFGCQTLLMSATMCDDVTALRKLMLHEPTVVRLDDPAATGAGGATQQQSGRLTQFYLEINSRDKYLLAYSLIKLQLLKPRSLIYTNSINTAYRLKLLLEKFSIPSVCVLNTELPLNSRLNVIQQFDRGMYDWLIIAEEQQQQEMHATEIKEEEEAKAAATPESAMPSVTVEKIADDAETETAAAEQDDDEKSDADADSASDEDSASEEEEVDVESLEPSSKRRKTANGGAKSVKAAPKASESSMSRGLDFKDVTTVVNFDMPSTADAYSHRVGRAARASRSGMALSFVDPSPLSMDTCVRESIQQQQIDAAHRSLLKAVDTPDASQSLVDQTAAANAIQPALQCLPFALRDIDGFRYRVDDMLRSITRIAVKEARLSEVKKEMLNSEALKAFFEDHSREAQLIRHDRVLHKGRKMQHLKHVPDYLLPSQMQQAAASTAPIEPDRPLGQSRKEKHQTTQQRMLETIAGKKRQSQASNPLVTFEALHKRLEQPKVVRPMDEQLRGSQGTFSDSRVGLRDSQSGRERWKKRHDTGSRGGKQQDDARPKRKQKKRIRK